MTQPGEQPNPWSREGQHQPEGYLAPKPDPPPPAYPPPPTGFYPPPAPYLPPPRKRRTGMWVALGVATAVLVGFAMWGVIADNRAHPVSSPSDSGPNPVGIGDTRVVTAKDKKSELTVPNSWKDVPTAFKVDEASIQLGDLRREQYIVVTSVDMTDFEDFEAFATASIEAVRSSVVGAQIGAPSKLTIGGRTATRYEFTGTSEGIKAVFWYAMVEGKRGFYQLIGWTLPSRKDEAGPVILKVMDSFRELAAG